MKRKHFSKRLAAARTDVFLFILIYCLIFFGYIIPAFWDDPESMLGAMFWLLVAEVACKFFIGLLIPKERRHVDGQD